MKNKFIIVFMLMVSLVFTGCSTKKTADANVNTNQGESVSVESAKTEDTKQEDTKVDAVEDESESVETENIGKKKEIDKSLTGKELLSSLELTPGKNLVMETEITGMDISSKMTSYYSGESTRTETLIDNMGKQITIYNASEGVTYQYTEGDIQGIIIKDGDEMSSDMELSAPSFAELTDEATEDIIARVETLGGKDVIYIEATESEEDMGNVSVAMWYSIEYGVPLKYEVKNNEEIVLTSLVIKIESAETMDKNLFIAPSDIEFEEFDIDSLFEMPEND